MNAVDWRQGAVIPSPAGTATLPQGALGNNKAFKVTHVCHQRLSDWVWNQLLAFAFSGTRKCHPRGLSAFKESGTALRVREAEQQKRARSNINKLIDQTEPEHGQTATTEFKTQFVSDCYSVNSLRRSTWTMNYAEASTQHISVSGWPDENIPLLCCYGYKAENRRFPL